VKILTSYTGPEGDDIIIHDVDYEDYLEAAEAVTHRYNDFFQLLDPVVLSDHMSYESDSSCFVIDFKGWGRHLIKSDRECRYLSVCFHFTVCGNPKGSPQVIFWCFQPKVSSVQQRKHFLWHWWTDNLVLIREWFKGVFAPTPFCHFPSELGTVLLPDPDEQGIMTNKHPPLRSEPPSLASCLAVFPWPKDPQVSDTHVDNPPSLLACISHHNPPFRKLPAWQVSCLEMSETDSQGTSHSQSSQSHQQSQSPQPHHNRQLVRSVESFKLALSNTVAWFTWKERPEKVALLADLSRRSDLIFQHAFLCVPDWKSQIWMWYYASCCPEVSNIRQVVDIAVVHQLEFVLAIWVSDMKLFIPVEVSGLDRMGIKALYQPGFMEPPFSYMKGTPAVFANAYVAKINNILCRPHAQAFVGMGGPYSWIAEHFGGPAIVKAFLSGPSIQVTRHLLGKSDSHEENSISLQWDQVSAQEGSFLFGFVPSQDSTLPEHYLFPPPHYLWELCNHWTGDWNEVMEKIFTHIADDVEQGKAEPHKRSWWSGHFQNYNRLPKPINPKFTDMNVEEARQILWHAGLPRTWDCMLLKSIIVQEHRILWSASIQQGGYVTYHGFPLVWLLHPF